MFQVPRFTQENIRFIVSILKCISANIFRGNLTEFTRLSANKQENGNEIVSRANTRRDTPPIYNNARCFQYSRHHYFTANGDDGVSARTEGVLSATAAPMVDVTSESANWHARRSEQPLNLVCTRIYVD